MENKKIFHFDNPRDVDELRKILEEDSDNQSEESFGEEFENEPDDVSERQDDSETEQEGESDEEEGIPEHFLGKDKSTFWRKNKPTPRRRGKENIDTFTWSDKCGNWKRKCVRYMEMPV